MWTATKPKGPGGRPKKADAERRSAAVHAEVTLAEKQFVREQRKAAGGISEAEYVRRRVLGMPITVPQAKTDARMIHELNAIGVNLNQIARNLNAGRGGARAVDLDELMAQLGDVLDRAVDAFHD